MNIESATIGSALPHFPVQAKPYEVSFEAALARLSREVQVGSAAIGQRSDLAAAVRPMLDGLIAEQRRFDARTASFDRPLQLTVGVGEGKAPEAFGDASNSVLEKITSAMSNMTEIATYVAKIQIIHKGVQGFQRVWDTLSKGQ